VLQNDLFGCCAMFCCGDSNPRPLAEARAVMDVNHHTASRRCDATAIGSTIRSS